MDVIVLTYDITNRDSFEEINFWFDDIKYIREINNLSIVLVGNKSDLKHKRVITYEEGNSMS